MPISGVRLGVRVKARITVVVLHRGPCQPRCIQCLPELQDLSGLRLGSGSSPNPNPNPKPKPKRGHVHGGMCMGAPA